MSWSTDGLGGELDAAEGTEAGAEMARERQLMERRTRVCGNVLMRSRVCVAVRVGVVWLWL